MTIFGFFFRVFVLWSTVDFFPFQMLGYLNTDSDIRRLFLLDEMCPRLVNMLLHVVTKLVGSKGMDLKVYEFELTRFYFMIHVMPQHFVSLLWVNVGGQSRNL